MTLTRSPEAEEYLVAVAARRGLPPKDALAQILIEENRRQERGSGKAVSKVACRMPAIRENRRL